MPLQLFKLWVFLFFIRAFCIPKIYGQALPPVVNFTQKDYNAHYQNWNIAQDSSGKVYFGNTHGLLTFNGNHWTLDQLNGNKAIRSVYYYRDKIFTGAYDEFGYWTNENNELTFKSLKKLIPDHKLQKEEVWNIIDCYGKLYLQSFSVLLVYDGKTIRQIETPDNFMFAQKVNNELYIQILGKGLFKIKQDGTLEFLLNTAIFKDKIVTGIIKKKDYFIVSTNSHGIFTYQNDKVKIWKSELQNYFESMQINRLLLTNNGKICMGTISDGLLIFDDGADLLFHINKSNGLNNNTVLHIFEDREKNIWCGLDNGISLIRLNSNVSIFKDKSGKIGNIFTSVLKDSILYIGTNHGVFYYDLSLPNSVYKEREFQLVRGTQGQVWQLKKIGNTIICGHNDGTFLIDRNQSVKISNITGGWCINEINNGLYLQSTYTGFCTFKSTNNWISGVKRVVGFDLPVKKFIMVAPGEAIGLNPSTGLYHLYFNQDYSKVLKWKKLLLDENNENKYEIDISKVGQDIFVMQDDNQYIYNKNKSKFDPIKFTGQAYKFREIEDKYHFKIYSDSLEIVDKNVKISIPQKVNQEYFSSTKLSNESYLFSIDEGFLIAEFDKKKIDKDISTNIIFDYVEANNQKKFFNNNQLILDYGERTFKLYLHQASYASFTDLKVSLETEGEFFRSIENKPFITFYNLSPGKYILKAKSNNGSSNGEFSIVINQPWYKSWFSFIGYILILTLLGYYIKKYFENQLINEKLKLEAENKRLLHEHLIELENTRLHEQNILKSKELANTTMHLIQKNEILNEIKSDLTDLRKSGQALQSNKEFQNLVKRIDFNLSVEDDKNLFETNFEEVHQNFLQKLESDFPDLTKADLKLAAYLRMDLSSKDICPLLNISIRGLENKRYRLRKKLRLGNEINLSTYFQKYI